MRFVLLSFVLSALAACTQDFGKYEPAPKDAAAGDSNADAVADTGTGSDAGPCNNGAVFMGHCYFAVSPAASWATQQAACTSAGGHLATVGSAAEMAAITNVGTGDRWIGLSRPQGSTNMDMSFVWVTGEPRTYTNWSAGEPSGSGLGVRIHADGTWADTLSTSPYVGLCERP